MPNLNESNCFWKGSVCPSDLGSRCSTSVAVGPSLGNCTNEAAYILLVFVIDFARRGQAKRLARKHRRLTLLTLCFISARTHLRFCGCFQRLPLFLCSPPSRRWSEIFSQRHNGNFLWSSNWFTVRNSISISRPWTAIASLSDVTNDFIATSCFKTLLVSIRLG